MRRPFIVVALLLAAAVLGVSFLVLPITAQGGAGLHTIDLAEPVSLDEGVKALAFGRSSNSPLYGLLQSGWVVAFDPGAKRARQIALPSLYAHSIAIDSQDTIIWRRPGRSLRLHPTVAFSES